MRTLILDNGSYEIKVGWADNPKCFHVKNAMMRSRDRRVWLGNAIDLCKDLTALQFRRPVERGQLYSWELEKAIWDWTWDTKEVVETVDEFKDSALIMTESPGSLTSSSGNTDQIIFEEYEFASYRRCLSQSLASNSQDITGEAAMVVDLGFQAIHTVPVIQRVKVVNEAVRRLDVGGKTLTNYLKEMVSYRHYNMMEESAILQRVKESCCFVSKDFASDLNKWHKEHQSKKKLSSFAIGYALPTHHDDPYGHVIPSIDDAIQAQSSGEEQVLLLDNERFTVPESIFDPYSHLGLKQAPLAETIADSIAASPEEYQPLLWSNIVVCGGTSELPNLEDRLLTELRKWAPSDVPVKLYSSPQGFKNESAWKGGVNLALDDQFPLHDWTISRQEYLEQGPSHVMKKFASTNSWKAS